MYVTGDSLCPRDSEVALQLHVQKGEQTGRLTGEIVVVEEGYEADTVLKQSLSYSVLFSQGSTDAATTTEACVCDGMPDCDCGRRLQAKNGDVASISGSGSDVKAIPLDVVSFSTGLSLFGVSALVWASQ